jgi:hypothetical protein
MDKSFELEQEILKLIEDLRYAMSNPDGMTDSDIQGRAAAIAIKYAQ